MAFQDNHVTLQLHAPGRLGPVAFPAAPPREGGSYRTYSPGNAAVTSLHHLRSNPFTPTHPCNSLLTAHRSDRLVLSQEVCAMATTDLLFITQMLLNAILHRSRYARPALP